MTTTLPAIIDQAAPLPALAAVELERAASYARRDKAPATRAACKSDFAAFRTWCKRPRHGKADAGRNPATIDWRCAAIRAYAGLCGIDAAALRGTTQWQPMAA
jgi:hypothetical protein